MEETMKLTKEDLLLAAEAAKLWPKGNFGAWIIDDIYFSPLPLTVEQIKPGYA